MFIERFFNPIISNSYTPKLFLDTNQALNKAKEQGYSIRHFDFRGDQYDGTKCCISKLKVKGWGRYTSSLFNYQSF